MYHLDYWHGKLWSNEEIETANHRFWRPSKDTSSAYKMQSFIRIVYSSLHYTVAEKSCNFFANKTLKKMK